MTEFKAIETQEELNEIIKKESALRKEKETARFKAKKQRLLKRSASKAIN